MAELRPFATAKQAADIGGITPTDIGVSATAFVRKSELAKTGKFDETSLASYLDTWFVNLDAVKKVSGGSAYIEWIPFGRILNNATSAQTFVSCRGDYVGDPTVKVSGELKNVTARIVASSVSEKWTHRIDLTFDKNFTLKDLTSTVTVTIIDADGKSISSSEEIVQNASKFEYEPTTLTFDSEDTTTQQVVTVVSPGYFSVSTDSPSWIGFSKQANATVKVYTLTKNISGSDRTGKLILTYNYTKDRFEVTVVQKAKGVSQDFEVSPTSLNFDADPTSGKDITITAPNRDWTATVDDEPITPKLEINPTSVDFEWNDTKGTNIDVNTNGLEFEGNVTYDDTSAGDWLELTTDEIEGITTIVSAKSSNTSGSVRTAKVTFTLKSDATVKAVLTVSQQTQPITPDPSDTLEVSPTSLSFTDDPTSGKTVQVTATGNWIIE